MSAPLLTTKLYVPPVRPELVTRPRLIERLDVGLERKLTLVSAPAGYGKTTLLSEWIHQEKTRAPPARSVAWLSLDEADNDPTRFLAYLIGAVQSIVPQIGEDLLSLLQSPEPPRIEMVLTSLINELAGTPRNGVRRALLGLVLDDYHLIENPDAHNAVAFLIDHLPPPSQGIHLIIATRKDPLLPLPRWRAGADMTDLREADLRFAHKEAEAFLTQAMGLDLSSDDVATLEARTEGWIAGLQLAALSMQGLDSTRTAHFISAFSGDDRHIVDYLVDEVLGQRPKGTKDFLLQTSILERMCGPLCDAVRFGSAKSPTTSEGTAVRFGGTTSPPGGDGGQQVLEMLEQANLFVVPLDNRRQWYRYHHMFADLLQHRLQATVGPARLRDLHIRASQWYEQNGHVREAVHHAFSAGDLTRAANLIEQNARGMFARSELGTIMDWVDALPKDVVGIRPWCCVYYAWALRLTGGQAEAVEARLRVAELALEKSQEALSKDEARAVLGHIAAIRAYQALYREEIQRVIDLSRQALDSLPEASFARGLTALALGWASRFNGDLARASRAFVEARRASLVAENTYVAVTATCRLAYTKMLGGQLRQATRSCQEALLLATGTRRRRLPVAGYALVYQGGVYREWNNLDKAKSCLKDGIDLCAQVGYVLDQVVGCTTLARVYQAQQDWDSAHEALQSAEQLSLRMKGYVFARRWVEDCQVRLWSAQDRFSEIARWTQETDLRVDDTITFERELEHIILARALVTLGREQGGEAHLEGALNLLARLLDKARSAGWMSKAIEILVLQALANQVRGHTDKALTALGRALSHAEPQGYVRTFVDEGPPMGRLLAEAIDHGIAPGYARSLLVAFGEVTTDREPRRQDEASASVVHPSAVLVETLSKRELEVLGLIAQGLTNQEIADRLCLALSTVKVHTRNIYGKLGVHNRTQAVAKAQSLDLM